MKKDYLETGEIVTKHGIHGELKVYPWADSPEFLTDFNRFLIDNRDYEVISCRVQGSCVLLKLKGIDTPEQAEAFRGKTLSVHREDCQLERGWFISDLIGLEVRCNGEPIGKLKDVIQMPGNDVWVVSGSREYLIPSVSEFIKKVSIEDGYAEVALLKGMASDED